jgi:hypothetical protein
VCVTTLPIDRYLCWSRQGCALADPRTRSRGHSKYFRHKYGFGLEWNQLLFVRFIQLRPDIYSHAVILVAPTHDPLPARTSTCIGYARSKTNYLALQRSTFGTAGKSAASHFLQTYSVEILCWLPELPHRPRVDTSKPGVSLAGSLLKVSGRLSVSSTVSH